MTPNCSCWQCRIELAEELLKKGLITGIDAYRAILNAGETELEL